MAPPPDAAGSGGLRHVRPDSVLGQALRRKGVLDPAVEAEPADDPAEDPSTVPQHRATGAGRRPGRARSILLGLGVGLGVGVAAIAIAFSVIAIPLYIIASTEPGSGLDRDLVRKGLFFVALPFGFVTGTAIGALVGVWYGRGGRLPSERSSIYGR